MNLIYLISKNQQIGFHHRALCSYWKKYGWEKRLYIGVNSDNGNELHLFIIT